MTEAPTFRSRDGLAIEGALDLPPDADAIVVFCHPHPKMGGTMNAPLILELRNALVERGWGVLRFNFRGIGGSEGESSTGGAEVADALGAIDSAREKGLPLAIAGWSFGGSVALRASDEIDDLKACVAIAPAIVEKPGVTVGVPEDLQPTTPVLVVIGSNDDQVSPAETRKWAERVPAATFVEMKGANHFFWGKYDDLGAIVGEWLEAKL